MEHKNVTHLCVHVYCGNRYRYQDEWKEHKRKEHEIGYYCEVCNKYCLFKDDLEEHMESHTTAIMYEEDLEEQIEIECRQCKEKFKSEEEIEKHEDDGKECDKCDKWLCHGLEITKHKKKEQCDLCGEYLCIGMSIERHKKREHGSNEKEDKEKGTKIQGEMIQDKNNGQEYEKWQYDGSKSKIQKGIYDGDNRKRHKKKKQKSTGKEGNKEGDKKNQKKEYDKWEQWQYDETKTKSHEKNYEENDRKRHKKKKQKSTRKKENKENEWKCVECETKCNSLETILKHIHENECGGWICCEEHRRKQKKNEERYTKKDECIITIKEPDIAKGLTENN